MDTNEEYPDFFGDSPLYSHSMSEDVKYSPEIIAIIEIVNTIAEPKVYKQ